MEWYYFSDFFSQSSAHLCIRKLQVMFLFKIMIFLISSSPLMNTSNVLRTILSSHVIDQSLQPLNIVTINIQIRKVRQRGLK